MNKNKILIGIKEKKHLPNEEENNPLDSDKILSNYPVNLQDYLSTLVTLKESYIEKYLESISGIQPLSKASEQELFGKKTDSASIQKIMAHAQSTTLKIINKYTNENDIVYNVRKRKALKNNKIILRSEIANRCNCCLLDNFLKYRPSKNDDFGAYNYWDMQQKVLNYFAEKMGVYLVGSFLNDQHKQKYYEDELHKLSKDLGH